MALSMTSSLQAWASLFLFKFNLMLTYEPELPDFEYEENETPF